LKISGGWPVTSRTTIEVSIPKAWVIGSFAEGGHIEVGGARFDQVAERAQIFPENPAGLEQITIGALEQLNLIAWFDAEGFQDFGREGDLAFGGDFEDHGRLLTFRLKPKGD
jgi:hypothetical protein